RALHWTEKTLERKDTGQKSDVEIARSWGERFNQATCLSFVLGPPAVISISTFRPAEVTMLTSVSIVNNPILPRTRSEIRGCDTPMTFAARDWVIFLSSI